MSLARGRPGRRKLIIKDLSRPDFFFLFLQNPRSPRGFILTRIQSSCAWDLVVTRLYISPQESERQA